MSFLKNLLKTNPIEHFSVVKLAFQNYAEVDPKFVEKNFKKLKESLNIFNHEGKIHEVKLRNCLILPTLTDGWGELKEYHQFPENVEVVFSYYGKNLCAVVMFKELHDPLTYPNFHSRSLDPNGTFYFDVNLDACNINIPRMVLPRQFGDFLKRFSYEILSCCTDLGYYRTFEILLKNDHNLTAQIGLDWNNFCKANNFQLGIIRFKFTNDCSHSACHVYQISTLASTSNNLIQNSHFPKWVARSANLTAGAEITLINDETEDEQICTIRKSTRKPPEFFLGLGWYQFVINMNLKVGDRLVFGMDDPPQHLHVVALPNVQEIEEE